PRRGPAVRRAVLGTTLTRTVRRCDGEHCPAQVAPLTSAELPRALGQTEPEAVDSGGPLGGTRCLCRASRDVERGPVLGARVRLVGGRGNLEHPLERIEVAGVDGLGSPVVELAGGGRWGGVRAGTGVEPPQ